MADAQKVIELIFKGVNQTDAAVSAVISNTDKLATNIQNATQPLADFTLGAVKMEAGILAAGVALAAFSIKQAADFESAVLDLQKVLTDADGPIEQFTDRARELAREYGVAATEVLQSMANFKQAGFDAQEASQLTKNALDLVIAGDLEAAQASDLLVAAIKGFGAEAGDASIIIDLLNSVSNEYATSLGELLIGFSQLSPVAKAAGLSFEETAGLLTPGIEVFRSGSEIATALRTSLLRLQSDSAPVQEALKAIGVAQEEANGSLRSAKDIYFDVAEAFVDLDDNQKTFIASQLVGLNQSAKFIAVTEGLDKTLRIAGDGFDFAGSAALEVAIRLASAEVAAARVKTSFNDLFVAIGTPLLDEFGGIAEAIAAVFDAIGASVQDGNFGSLVDYIESVMSDLENAISQVARNLPAALEAADLSGFSGGIQAVIDGFSTLFGEIDITSVDGLASAITFVGDAFEALSFFTKGVIESSKPLFDQVVSLGKNMEGLGREFFESGGFIGGFALQANKVAQITGDFLLPSLTALVDILIIKQGIGLVGALGKLSDKATGAAGALGQAGLLAAIGTLTYELSGALGLPQQVDNLVNSLTDAEQSLGTLTYDLVQTTKGFLGFEDANQKVAEALAPVAASMDKTAESANDNTLSMERLQEISADYLPTIQAIPSELSNLSDQSADTAATNYALADSVLATIRPLEEGASALFQYAGSLQEQEDKAAGLIPIFDETTGAIVRYEQAATAANDAVTGSFVGIVPIIDEATGEITGYTEGWVEAGTATAEFNKRISNTGSFIGKTAEETKKAAEAQDEWNKLILEMQHETQLALIEAQTAITTTRIEEDTKRIQAAFDSLNVTIDSTGNLLSDLFGLYASDNINLREQFNIESQIDAENKRRDEALELQKELTKAQIENLEARTESLQRGDSLITIKGEGLTPHIRAFMFEILEEIQLEVNAEGSELLLGLPAPA